MESDVETLKARLRTEQKNRFATLSQDERRQQESELCQRLAVSWNVEERPWVLGFLALKDEPDLDFFWKFVLDRGKLAFPRLVEGDLEFRLVDSLAGPWSRHPWGLRQPRESSPLWSEKESRRTLVVIPGLAFDGKGVRLGRGGGYYDRFLARLASEALLWGIGWKESFVEEIPVRPHDVRLDAWVGPNSTGLLPFDASSAIF